MANVSGIKRKALSLDDKILILKKFDELNSVNIQSKRNCSDPQPPISLMEGLESLQKLRHLVSSLKDGEAVLSSLNKVETSLSRATSSTRQTRIDSFSSLNNDTECVNKRYNLYRVVLD
jgi:hypothetical protein